MSAVLPAGLGSSCSAQDCALPAYETFVGRLVEMRGATATYAVTAVVGGEYPASTAKVGRRRVVQYRAQDAALLRIGESYRVELNGGGPGVDSSMHRACSSGTTFTDGSRIAAQTWWQRNHVALAIVVAITVIVAAATWLLRRRRARGEPGRLEA